MMHKGLRVLGFGEFGVLVKGPPNQNLCVPRKAFGDRVKGIGKHIPQQIPRCVKFGLERFRCLGTQFLTCMCTRPRTPIEVIKDSCNDEFLSTSFPG